MNIWVEPGKYVVAVSGGIDSMVLLDILAKQPGLQLTVAHFDHGMRPDSKQDRMFVQQTAANYRLPFVFDEGSLGFGASEDKARKARYKFLQTIRSTVQADAIITAHHQDDMLETAILNAMRGTGRRGVTALQSRRNISRPLLGHSKQDIQKYAHEHKIQWQEDATNADTKYLRNFIRHKIIPVFSAREKQALLSHIDELAQLNRQIDGALELHLHVQPSRRELDRHWFIMLPHKASLELLAAWLRSHGIAHYDAKLLDTLVVRGKTLSHGKQVDIDAGHKLEIKKDTLALSHVDR